MTTATPFTATVASEWTKLRSLRSTFVTLALGCALGLALTAVVTIVIGATWDDWSAADRASFEPALPALAGIVFSSIAIVVIGVNAVTADYSSGLMRLTLTATPRRGRVLLAKTAVVAAVTLVAGSLATVTTFLLGQAILGAYGLHTASLGESDALRAVLGTSVLGPVLPVIALCLAVVLRSKVGAVTAVLGLVFAPAIFGGLLPASVQENVLIYLPSAASDSIAFAPLDDEVHQLAPGIAIAVLAAWLAASLGTAYLAFTRRDA